MAGLYQGDCWHNSMNSVCAIVVTYNRKDMLKECLSYLMRQTVPCDIIVVDNNSDDGTSDFLDSFANIIHLRMDKNLGGAGGFNVGMKEAVRRGYDYAWVMDDDTFPQPQALEKLLEADAILEGKYGWLCSVPLWTDGNECRMNRPKLLKAFYSDIHLLQHSLVRAEQATFVSLFVKTSTIKGYGLPIKEFFIWGDDMEFTRRLSVRKKLPCYLVGKSIVTHAMKSNVGSNIAQDDFDRIERYNYAFRNDNYLYRQEGIKGCCYYFAKCGMNIFKILTKAKDNRIKRLWIVVKQMVIGLFFNPKIEYVKENAYR